MSSIVSAVTPTVFLSRKQLRNVSGSGTSEDRIVPMYSETQLEEVANAAVEASAVFAENGSFLSDGSPEAVWAKSFATALRRTMKSVPNFIGLQTPVSDIVLDLKQINSFQTEIIKRLEEQLKESKAAYERREKEAHDLSEMLIKERRNK